MHKYNNQRERESSKLESKKEKREAHRKDTKPVTYHPILELGIDSLSIKWIRAKKAKQPGTAYGGAG